MSEWLDEGLGLPETRQENTPVYRYFMVHSISERLILELPFTEVTWSRQIRRAGSFTGSVAVDRENDELDLFWGTMPGWTSIYVTRYGVPVWGGMVDSRSYQADTGQLQVTASSFEAYLYRRYAWHTLSWTGVDSYQVVRDLIGRMQTDYAPDDTTNDDVARFAAGASLNVEVESRNAGTQHALTVDGRELRTFGEIIEEYSNNIGGFEYNIDVGWDPAQLAFTKTLVFRDTPPSQVAKGAAFTGERTGLDRNYFEYPGNVITLGYEDTIEGTSTRYFVTGQAPEGASEGLSLTPRETWNNAPYLSRGWPLLEFVESSRHSNVTSATTLERYARRYGQQVKPPLPSWNVVVNGRLDPQVGTYRPGDWCRLLTKDQFLMKRLEQTNDVETGIGKRIVEFSVTVPDAEHVPETVTLGLADEWSDDDAGGT